MTFAEIKKAAWAGKKIYRKCLGADLWIRHDTHLGLVDKRGQSIAVVQGGRNTWNTWSAEGDDWDVLDE